MSSNPFSLAQSFSEPTGEKLAHTKALLASIYRENKLDHALGSDSNASDLTESSLINQAIQYLSHEQEDDLKTLLKESFGCPDDADVLDNQVLDLMHKHRDDIAGVPFLFLTPSKRPISRPSSRASSHSVRLNRPETPTSAPPYPSGLGFRRPHTPMSSPMNPLKEGSSYLSGAPASPKPSSTSLLANTSVPSPLSSPRLLNATAAEFKPIPRPLSAAGSQSGLLGLRADTPSPDLWPHKASNLAIAAPLLPDSSVLPVRSSSSLAKHSFPHEDENDEFDPFAIKPPPSFRPLAVSSDDGSNHDGATSNDLNLQDNEAETDDMTPFDVLTSIFGSTLSQPELEEALENNGYDFESAMAWIVDKSSPLVGPQETQNMSFRPDPLGNSDKIRIAPRDAFFREGFRGGFFPRGTMRGNMRGGPAGRPGGNKVCRYYLAGECMRADCRFSHDLDRALCRFWLRGICAKGEFCEFLHHLPKEQDVNALTSSMDSFHMGGEVSEEKDAPDFPALGDRSDPQRRPVQADPGRIRFAAAVKRPGGFNRGESYQNSSTESFSSASIPKPSPRIKLRLPTLLPTLPTGEVLNAMYMSYRTRALQLGAARNACLSRAAEAWRRGDGAGAKRFSRDGQDLNSQMKAEARVAAGKLVRERAKVAMDAVRNRDASWSDDPGDRVSRGRVCGGGLGVCLGITSKKAGMNMDRLTAEERTEVMLDLHGLHSNEATEVLEEYLLALEKEHFLGLAFLVVGEQKHTGMQDPNRGVSKARLAAGVREWLHRWGYPWMERDGIMAVDPITHA